MLTLLPLVCFALFLARWAYYRQHKSTKLPHPPGPPGLPLVGNLRDIPKNPVWMQYLRWSREYRSDLVRLNILGSNFVVVNTLDAAVDLLEKRSSIYSDRLEMPMLNELCGYGWSLAFARYGDYWKDTRRAFHREFQPEATKRWRAIEEQATHHLLRDLLDSPQSFMRHLRHLAGSEIMKIAYGIDVQEKNDSYITTAEHALESIAATANVGSYLVDVFPVLKYVPEWFPGAGFKKEARLWKVSVDKMRDAPFEVVKRQMETGELPQCAARSLLEGMNKTTQDPMYTEYVIKATLGAMYTGGADTTVSALGSFFLAMVLYPDVQKKAQQEIDRVLNNDRLPSFGDLGSLPRVDAIVKEALRWNPVVPLDVPHRSSTDDVYAGYYLPKDTLVVANSWAILHDEDAYPDPLTFNPERFIKDDKINPDVRDPAVAAFGFGRRICPGRFMAYESMWIAVASTLAVFNIAAAVREDGTPITPTAEYELGFLCYPKPFPCNISPRSPEHEALIRATVSNA